VGQRIASHHKPLDCSSFNSGIIALLKPDLKRQVSLTPSFKYGITLSGSEPFGAGVLAVSDIRLFITSVLRVADGVPVVFFTAGRAAWYRYRQFLIRRSIRALFCLTRLA